MLFEVSYALLWTLAVLHTLLVLFLVNVLAEIRAGAAAGVRSTANVLPLGNIAPEFSAVDLRSRRAVDSSTLRGHRVVLCFLSATCRECKKLLGQFAELDSPELRDVILVCTGPECEQTLPVLPGPVPVIVASTETVSAFQLRGFPTAVVLDEAWRIVGYRYPSHPMDVLESLLPRTMESRTKATLQPA